LLSTEAAASVCDRVARTNRNEDETQVAGQRKQNARKSGFTHCLSRESTRSAAPWIARKKTLHSTHHRHHPQGQRVAGDKVVGRLALDPEIASDAEGEREHHDDPDGGPVACATTMRSGENERG